MLPLGRQAGPADGASHPCLYSHDEQRFLMSLWAIARAPLVLGAQLPLDANDTWTLPLVSTAAVLRVNEASCGNAPAPQLGPTLRASGSSKRPPRTGDQKCCGVLGVAAGHVS